MGTINSKVIVKSIYIENFRDIKKLDGEIEFTKINILIGPNNSGKTSILEALSLLPYSTSSLPYPFGGSRLDFLEKTLKRDLNYLYVQEPNIEYKVFCVKLNQYITIQVKGKGSLPQIVQPHEFNDLYFTFEASKILLVSKKEDKYYTILTSDDIVYIPSMSMSPHNPITFLDEIYQAFSKRDWWVRIESKIFMLN